MLTCGYAQVVDIFLALTVTVALIYIIACMVYVLGGIFPQQNLILG